MSVFSDAIKNFLSPINDLLDDEAVSEVMINGPLEIYVEKKGLVYKTSAKFRDEEDLQSAIRAIAQSVGKTIDEQNPRLDARLPDGSRIAAVIPPMAQKGTTVAIRKFSKDKLVLKDLINFGSVSKEGARFLDICVYLGKNLVVSGGTGSGKTTLLNVLGGRIPTHQRLITIEDSSELQIAAEHVVNFVTRRDEPAKNIKGVTIRDLVHSAMRLRPDRIIVGEVRGEEALDLIQVMNTGHDGSMGTVHANNPEDACLRLETLCLMSDTHIPPDSIKKMIAGAVDVIVQCQRLSDGSRRVTHVSEVLGVDPHGNYELRHIFIWKQKGKSDDGKLIGEMVPTGKLPTFFHEIKVNKLPFPRQNFQPPQWAQTELTPIKKAS